MLINIFKLGVNSRFITYVSYSYVELLINTNVLTFVNRKYVISLHNQKRNKMKIKLKDSKGNTSLINTDHVCNYYELNGTVMIWFVDSENYLTTDYSIDDFEKVFHSHGIRLISLK